MIIVMLLTLAFTADTLTKYNTSRGEESSKRKYEGAVSAEPEVKHTTQYSKFQDFDVIPLPVVRTTPMNSDIL